MRRDGLWLMQEPRDAIDGQLVVQMLRDLMPAAQVQGSLFEAPDNLSSTDQMEALGK